MPRFLDVVPRIPVSDLPRARAFYTATLGFTVDVAWPDDVPTFAILARDDAQLQLYVPGDRVARGETMLNVAVTDALAVHEALPDDVVVEWGPEDFWYGRREFAFRDPDGHLVIVTQALDGDDDDDDDARPMLTDRLLS